MMRLDLPQTNRNIIRPECCLGGEGDALGGAAPSGALPHLVVQNQQQALAKGHGTEERGGARIAGEVFSKLVLVVGIGANPPSILGRSVASSEGSSSLTATCISNRPN